jgi:acetyl-CoA carboxylase biotin carboxyl carrier protein
LDLKEIKELIALMRKNDLSVFKMENNGVKITLKRGSDYQPIIQANPAGSVAMHALPAAAPAASASAAASTSDPSKLAEITSPMVGTFYGAPTPDAQPYVKVGMEVQEDTVVCIIEAMKVMNEIKAECRGTIAEIIAENGKPVQFGQPLFRLQTK